MEEQFIFHSIDTFRILRSESSLLEACRVFIDNHYPDVSTAILELAKHYEDGARKYADRNRENGIPVHCFIDSGVRHLLKVYRGDTDEPHDRAFLWNMVGALWTMRHHPELDDFTVCEIIPEETKKHISEQLKEKFNKLSSEET